MYRQKRASAAAGSNAAAADTVVLSSQVFQVRPGRAADGWSADTDDIQPDIHLFSSCLEKGKVVACQDMSSILLYS